jgi:hypothetical protein
MREASASRVDPSSDLTETKVASTLVCDSFVVCERIFAFDWQ